MADIDEAHVRRILDVSLRFGQLLLGSQAGTADVASSIGAVASAYGLAHIQVDITGNSITVSIPRGCPARRSPRCTWCRPGHWTTPGCS